MKHEISESLFNVALFSVWLHKLLIGDYKTYNPLRTKMQDRTQMAGQEAGRKAEQEPANTAQHNHDNFGLMISIIVSNVYIIVPK